MFIKKVHRTTAGCPRTYLLMAAVSMGLVAANQTSTVSPVDVDGGLAYGVELRLFDIPASQVPSLHSFARAQYDGKWILLAGRTNGIHDFTQSGIQSFPPEH